MASAPRPHRAGRFTRSTLVLAVIALVAATSGALAFAVLGEDDEETASTTTTTASTTSTTTIEPATLEELSGPARDLAELLDAGRQLTYHARYAGSTEGSSGGTIALESWAKNGQFRQDVRFDIGGVAIERATFVLDDRGVSCDKSGADEPWVCSDVPRSEVQGAEPLTGSTLAQLRDATVGEQEGEVDGRPARCFTVSYDAQTTEMCVSPDGVPLQIRTAQSRLVVEVLEDVVDDAVFNPPAPSTSDEG